ncbi:hypothetical protein VTN96DRAFT_6446 [Rasamsonia emersonii]
MAAATSRLPPAWFLSRNISGKRAGTSQETVDDLAKPPRAGMEIQSRLVQLAMTVGAKEIVAKITQLSGQWGDRQAYQIRRWRGS